MSNEMKMKLRRTHTRDTRRRVPEVCVCVCVCQQFPTAQNVTELGPPSLPFPTQLNLSRVACSIKWQLKSV